MRNSDSQEKRNKSQYLSQESEFTRKLAKILVKQIKHDIEVKNSKLRSPQVEVIR